MARSLSQALIGASNSSVFAMKSRIHNASRLLSLRTQSSQPENSHPNLVDSDTEQQREALAVQKLEDAIHRIIVIRSAPGWLPFLPGSSYWVPPRRLSYGIAELIQKLANTLTEEEVMSLITVRGWPSSSFFLNGASPHPAEIEKASKPSSQSDDEEG